MEESHPNQQNRPARLPFLRSPLVSLEVSLSTSGSYYPNQPDPEGPRMPVSVSFAIKRPMSYLRKKLMRTIVFQNNNVPMFETPQFQHHNEATAIELFYDLFFVANLTTFTGLHEINDPVSLKAYIGFFCILWFTWCQVGLYDVRFVADSIIERMAKACQFGVMVGLAGKWLQVFLSSKRSYSYA